MKTVGKWRSERLQRDVTMVRWGTFGQPVLVFPPQAATPRRSSACTWSARSAR